MYVQTQCRFSKIEILNTQIFKFQVITSKSMSKWWLNLSYFDDSQSCWFKLLFRESSCLIKKSFKFCVRTKCFTLFYKLEMLLQVVLFFI